MKFFSLVLIGVLFCFPIRQIWAAACCARNAATPMLIVTDDQSQLSFGMSLATVAAEPGKEGAPIWMDSDHSEVTRNFRLEGATLLSDQFQIGGSFMVVDHQIGTSEFSDSSFGLGDFKLSSSYEIFPAWSYSRWKPQGFLFSVITVPVGRSIYESVRESATDVTGNGFYSLSVGILFIKRWSLIDVFLVPEVHYSLPRRFENSDLAVQISPGLGGSVGLGAGISPGGGHLRVGGRIHPKFDQPRLQKSSQGQMAGQSWIMNTDIGIDVSYMLTGTDTVMMSYTDQTWIGPALNSNLNRVFAINLQHRWER